MQTLILCKTLTNAQRGALLLERRGFTALVVKAPQALRTNGCGYALNVPARGGEAARLLKSSGLLSGRVYRRGEDGEYREADDDLS